MASSCNCTCPITLKERKKKQTNNKQTTETKPFAQFSLFYNLDVV